VLPRRGREAMLPLISEEMLMSCRKLTEYHMPQRGTTAFSYFADDNAASYAFCIAAMTLPAIDPGCP
jgi:hypothetical protein